MTDSALPPIKDWWRGDGAVDGGAVAVRAGSSTTPYDEFALPVGSRKWAVDIVYTAAADASLWLVVNQLTADNKQVGDVKSIDVQLSAGDRTRKSVTVDIPETASAKWLPSLRVKAPTDVTFHEVKVYEADAASSPDAFVWDGGREVPARVTVWAGAEEVNAARN